MENLNNQTTSEFSDEIELKLLFKGIWLSRYFIILLSFIGATFSVFYAISIPDTYKSEATVLVETNDNDAAGMSQYSGLASMAGISLGGSSANRKDEILHTMISRKFINEFVNHRDILIPLFAFEALGLNKETYTNIGFIIHHVIGLCGGLSILYYKFYGILTLYLCCHEISTIFLNLKHLNICKDFSDKMFIVTFLTIRCTTLPIMVVKTYLKSKFLFIIMLTDCGLHIFWISQKIGNIRKKAKIKAKLNNNNNNDDLKLNIIEYGEKID